MLRDHFSGEGGEDNISTKPLNHGNGLSENPLTPELVCMSTVLELNAKGGDNRGSNSNQYLEAKGVLKERKEERKACIASEEVGFGIHEWHSHFVLPLLLHI